jgi:hypothetical protein
MNKRLHIEKTCRAIVLTGTFTTGEFYKILYIQLVSNWISSGIDMKYLSTIPNDEFNEIDDIARKAIHLRRIIQRTQASLRAIDKVNKDLID